MTKTKYEIYYSSSPELDNLDLKIDRMDRALIRQLGSAPDSRYIHVAGTNGKGSTSLFISSMLEKEGYSTMLFTSPHIHSVCERINYRNVDITCDELDTLFDEGYKTIEAEKLSFFEGIFLLFMMYAAKNKPDFIILETGLGGTLDATNCSFISSKIPVITTVAQDHKDILGNNIYTILKDKLGIVKNSPIIFVGKNESFIYDEIRSTYPELDLRFTCHNVADEVSKLYNKPFSYNYMNAIRVVEFLLGKNISPELFPLPMCRQERIGRVIIDGAHNPSGMYALINNLEEQPGVAVLSATKERDLKKLADIASKQIPEIIFTTIPGNSRSKTLEQLKSLGGKVAADPIIALKTALDMTDKTVLVAGSLYLCAYIRRYLVNLDD